MRAVWLAWSYYFAGGPRYRLESAVIALLVVGALVVILRSGSHDVEVAHQGRLPLLWLPVFLVAAIALYAPALSLGLLSDDYTLSAMAQSDRLGGGSGWFLRPLPLLLWRVLLSIGGSATLLHLANVALHGLNAYLVAVVGTALAMRRDVALGGAALFLTFPAAPEAVAWAAGIQDVLTTTMALGCVVLAGKVSQRNLVGLCTVFALGLATKETAICIPALIAICWMTPSRVRRNLPIYVAVAVTAGVYLAIRLPMGVGNDYIAAPSRYFFKQMVVTAFGTLSTPWRAPATTFDRGLAFVAATVLLLLLVYASLSWHRKDARLHRDIRLAGWVLASVAPVFTLFFVDPQLQGSRYLYLAECGWALLVADLIMASFERTSKPSLMYVGLVSAAVCVSIWTVERELGVWRRAADLRDRVLVEAHAVIAQRQCVNSEFMDVPDSVDGAYVFRNGFREAMNLTAQTGSAQPSCTFSWAADRFLSRQP